MRLRTAFGSPSTVAFFRMRFRSARILSDSLRVASISRRASSRVLRMVVSRRFSISLRSFSASSRRRTVSLAASSAIFLSFSAIWRWYSAFAMTSSKRMVSPESNALASSIRLADSPRRREISNALLFPGTPIDRRYVGRSVSTLNSTDAFSTPGVDSANAFSSA